MVRFPFKNRNFKYRQSDAGKISVWDIIRKRYVSLTPEENVRQHIIHGLINDLGIPQGKIAVEKELIYNGLKKRFDILVYDNNIQPYILVECKAPSVPIDQDTLLQSSVYYQQLNARYILMTNGHMTFLAEKTAGQWHWKSELHFD